MIGIFYKKGRLKASVFMVLVAGLCLAAYWHSLPKALFPDPYSTVIVDREGNLLGARIAADGQWRFPLIDSVPHRFEKALLTFEDRYYYRHPGVNPLATGRALLQNIRAGKTVSGGSTISMQVVRLSRRHRPRTIGEKVIEMMLATRLELRFSKKEILKLYASHAPFGGNVVGLDAAAWRYFGSSPHELSWAEAATLAVLPNAPALIYPGKNEQLLLQKRNRLLDQLQSRGHLDSLTCVLAKAEPLPGRPYPLPMHATHLLTRAGRKMPGQRIHTTIDPFLQKRTTQIAEAHHRMLRANEVHNAAILVAHVQTGEVLAYVGNTFNMQNPYHGQQVDVITAQRSTGSILKPFLYARLMEEGVFLPNMLVPDIPTQIAGYSPKNYFLTYDGAVPAKRSLSRSLNVPSVRMLREYGVEKFHHELKHYGMSTLVHPPSHYGLSLILGGADGTLWDITGMYASFSRVLGNHHKHYGKYNPNDIRSLHYIYHPEDPLHRPEESHPNLQNEGRISAASVWLTWEALVEVNRPDAEAGWERYSSQGKIAWKTGTSFGGRDAWAIGTTRDYVVGVWVGNASGEGRPGLSGLSAAAPIMFEVFDLLPAGGWFEQAFSEMELVAGCRQSGHRAGMHCTDIDSVWVHRAGLRTPACPYHTRIHLDADRKFRVNTNCADSHEMIAESWFVLPPVIEWYYRRRNPSYKSLPPIRSDCLTEDLFPAMEMIYPHDNHSIFIPRMIDGTIGEAVFEVAHRTNHTTIFWHLNDEYLGQTRDFHQMGLSPGRGDHTLTLVDENGETLVVSFDVKNRD